MWNDDDRKWLYEQMRKNGVNTGSYDDFSKSLDNKEDRDWYYQKSRSLGLNVGSADDFASMMVQPVQKPAPAPAQPVAKPVQTQVQTQLQPVATGGHDGEGGAIESHGNGRSVGEAQPAPAMASSVPVSGVDVKTVVSDKDGSGNTVGNDNVAPGRGWDVNGKHFTSLDDSLRYIEEQDAIPGRGWKIGDKEFGSAEDADRYVKSHPEMRFRFMSRDGVRFDNVSDLVRHRRERDAAEMVERRISSALTAYDPDNVAESVWDDAERRSAQDFGDYLSSRREVSVGNVLHDLASAGDVSGGLGADNYEVGIQAFASHLKYHDLRRMADEAWERLGKEKRDAVVGDIYGALRERYPDADSSALMSNASAIAKEQSDKRMFELAVEKHAPQSATDYFFRKAFTSNALHSLMVGLGRYQSGSIGDMEARDVADQRYGEEHKLTNIAGTVTGMAIDPLTWIAGGVGGGASKGAMWLGGKLAGDAVMRKFGSSLAGRMLGGVVGGAANLGVFEAGGELLEQQKWGGAVGVSPETGHYEVGDYDLGAVGGRFVHGMAMGAGTGMVAPLIGNVSDKLVRATESTVGKLGIRAGELGVSTVAEGTIFSIPEWIEGNRDAMDVWTDNMAMMAGFKTQHLLKSVPRVIGELAASKNGKAGFETRLRSILDGRGDLALTEDEKKELERRGYDDLKDLTEEYSRYAEAKEEYDKARPTTTDASRMIEGGDGQAELPYNRFVDLMTDNSVSEAARAKMYYYLTGHGLPMSTVMGFSILEDKDADGNVTGYTVQSFGANGVITSRSFGDKKRADVEANRINRQAELNGFDVGERYYDWQGDNKRMYEACESVAEETGAPANLLFDLMKRKTEAMNEVELEWAEKILNAYNGLGDKYGSSEVRAAINDEFGVDIDKAIRKEPGRRSEQEQKAASEYANRLFADVKRKQEEAAERGETPASPDAPTSNSQIAALLGIDDGEQGDPVSAAFNRGHEADAQERQDIAIEVALATQHTGLDAGEAQEAWNGVVQRINEDAAYMVAQQREQTKQMQHTDGSLRPAILKEKDSEGNDQQVYIVDGNVQMMPDGSMVDKASSDNIVVVYNPATGERKQIDPSADTGISSLGEVTTAEQREADIERSRQEYVQAQIDEAQGTVRFVPGQQLVLPTGEEAVVVATDADGENITVALGDGTQATVQRSELQRIRDEKTAADYRQRHGITEEPATQQPEASTPAQPQADGRVAGAPADYTADMELTIRDEDGSEKPAMVMGRVRYENGSFVPDANGNIIEYFMDGEVKHDHEDKLIDKVVSHVAPQQPETAPVQEASAETPATVETTPPPVEQQAEVAQQPVQEPVQTVEPQPAQPAEAPAQPTEQPTAEPMPVGEDGEEDWQATTPERAHAYIFNEAGLSRSEGNEFIAAQTQAAQSALVKAKSAQMPRVGTSIKKYNEAKAQRQEKIDEAQRVLDYWNGVREIQNAIQREENERRAAEDAVRHDEAVAEAQAEYEARKQAEAERKAVGNENPMPAITEKWNNATKVDGHRDEIMLPDGTPLKGHYVLHESGASSPSHNPETWQKTDGFPMDANDNSVNDRDYERDHDAQEHTQSIARQYDQRALQSVPVVSNDGVVLSGNGRTMAGELAARDNTDGAYVNYLKEYASKFGFTPEQVDAMQHPRVSFVPDEAMPYTAETFAKFNQQEMKSQNKTEQAVKLGKTVSDDSFKGIVRTINGYDTLGDFYNDAEASLGAVYDLHNAGVVPQAQLAEMVDGIRGQEKLSAVGREFLENMLIGKAFESDPEVVRMLTAEPAMRQTVITALGEIVDNIALGGDWSLQGELADAVKLCFDARQGGAKYGEIVSTYARQGVLFADPDELQTVADFNNATMLMLADVLNDKRVTLLKTTLQLYNNNARQSASGQTDLFAGGIQSREDILRDVITFINENYGKRKEIEAARAAAVERRKAESVQQDGTPPAVNSGSEDTRGSERGSEEIAPLTHDEAITIIAQMEERAEVAPEIELTIENWDAQFGEDGYVSTPIGEVKMGENQFTKLMRQGRESKLGMIKPTLENPDVIIEDASEAKDGDVAERKSSYVFVKAFKKADGSRYYYFTSVTVSKEGKEVVISNQEKRKNAIANLLTNGKLVWKHADDVSAASDVEQGLYSSQGKMSDPTTEGTDAPQTNDVQKGKLLYRFDGGAQTEQTPASVSVTTSRTNPGVSAVKVSEKSSTVQEKTEKVAENQTPNAVQAALAAAEQETNTEPTEAQKEAGNYKKGHVKIDGYDVTIENPKGSVRRGTDASGKQWEQEMQNTYGYIRGTEGVDGDHIDVFFSEDPSQGDVFVVDQVNKDGSFDEHKVMYGFPYIESARKAYLSNYGDDWQGLGAITPVSKEEFKKWIDSSHRKTKPFAEYSSVKPLGDTQLGEQPNKPTVKAGEDYVSAAERIAKEHEVKRTAAHFAEETQEEATAFDKRVPEMDDVELLAYMQEDGRGDLNKAHHPSVYDEYDYRHDDEQLQSYDATLVRLNESGTTLEQAEEMLANLQKDVSRFATDERAELLGQEEALQEYIAVQENRKEEMDEVTAVPQQTEQASEENAAASEYTTEKGNKLSVLRSKYPDRVFGEQHEDGSVTFHDEDALLVSQLIGREFDGEDLTLAKEEADKALQKLIANGHKVAFYGTDYKPKYDEHGNRIESNPQKVAKKPAASKKASSEQTGKIDDVGERLEGARKDMCSKIAESLANVTEAALIEKPFGKVYKKPDLKKAVESGALREKDAIFYEALFSMVNQQKPKVTQSEMRSKRYIPDFKTKAERWAADTFKQMEVLRQFMELDEPGRDAMMERMLADRYPTREQELAEIEKRKGWNPDYEGHKYEWGDMTTPNPLRVTHEVMNRLGYSVGDKLDVPYGVVKANTSGTGYSIENLKGERASLFGSGMTLDEAIDRIVYLAKLKRGDADVSHPTQLFAFPATKSESGESGRYRVMWGRDYKTREFDSKDEADAFAQTKNGAYVSPIMETKRKFGYKVRFTHPLTGEKMFVDDTEFDTKEEAQAYFDGNFEKLNEATNAKLQEEREKKGEKKTLTADDVVHVTMVHSGKDGWTHAVVIDKKYANNDGQVRIIKEGFANRNDAKTFADSVKDDVLKTVLKHKEDAKKIVYFDTGENSRIGEDYRNGKNVDAEDFMNTFGFRGVQFGNWTNQADRQMAVNQAYDAFMDMARLIGVSPKAMSLNGELGIAFGARGVGGFAAHYEPGEVVINLTKTQGAGSLAHEWWHALDNYFARRAGSAGDMVTDNRRIEMRDALRKAFNDMLDLVKGSDYALRSAGKGEYWGRTHEITARLLAEWVDRELKKRGELNTFLSRGAVVERGQQHNYDVYEVLERLAGREPMPFEDYRELPESLKGIPYPSAKEVELFGGPLRHIFDTLEEKVDEETGNVMLYEPTATYETRDGGKVVCRSLFDEMGVRSSDEVAMVSQHTQQGQGQNQVIAPSEIRLRKLKKGETCHVERVYEETKQFDFTGKEKVESAEDVAYIFRQLENAAVENSFLVLVKDGRPTVIHLGVGSYIGVMAPYEQAFVAYKELNPDQVYFVHNHPSGTLKASRQDQDVLNHIKRAFGEDVVQQGIIIDTTSGNYGEFESVETAYETYSVEEEMPQSQGGEVPVKVYQFSRQVFAPDWNPESAFKIVSSQSVAEFVSSHRLGKHKKMSFLVVNNSGNVVANVFLPWTKLSDIKRSKDAGDLLAGYVHQCGGVRGVLYGNYDYEADDRAVLAAVGGRMRQLNAPLMDALHVEHSAYENGWAGVGEPKEGYGVNATPFHNIIDEMFGNEDFDKSAHARERYDLGATPEWMKGIGISGERFTLSFKNIKTHLGKDADHNLTAKEWHELPSALKHPFLVTSYGNKDGKFRLYTTIKVGDKFAVVGVDVVRINQGKGVPMLELNRIKTVFGRDRYIVENGERILAWDKNITPEQEALLRGHNYREYPTIQELSAAKIGNNSDIAKENGENVVGDTAKYRIREDEPPTKTGIGYKVFVLKDGKLYPPMVANPNGEATPVGVWLDADAAPVAGVTKTGRQQVKAGGKGTQGGSGKLAYRPGWHLGEIPYAVQFNRMNPETGQRELFPANFVWAEVEYANDVDYQEEAMSYGMNASGKFQHSLAGLPRLPENGSYRYRTNPDPNTDPWVITGAMKVNRILKPSEVDAMVEAAGREPQQRQAGAITDEQVEALNAKVKRTMQEDRDMMRSAVQQMGEKLHTDINIIEDVNEITHPNAAVQERRRKSKGWYDTATGQVNIVLDNNKNIDDVKASVGHETIAHKGLRELVGEENYDEFLDETYQHLRDDLKKGVDAAAGRAFIDDTTKNGKRAKSYDQHRRTAVDELFGRMAEKPFEEFSEGERTLWQKIKATVRRLLDKFLGSLKLPKWFELGDNELRYILWRSKERLERGKEHPIDLARDIVKREELGLTDEARYNMGDVSEPSFAARRDRAVKERGYVHPGLNSAEVKVVFIKEKSPFESSKKTKALKEDVVAYANEHNITGTMTEEETKGKGKVTISNASIEKMVDDSATDKSVNKDTHLSIIPQLREVIAESNMAETHPDYIKDKDGKRTPENGYNGNVLIHRCYGAVNIDGTDYRVKITLKEDGSHKGAPHKAYTYEVTKIELLDSTDGKGVPSTSYASNSNGRSNVSDVFVSGAKLLNNLEKSYEKGKNLLDESKLADESTDLYRDPDDTDDVWTDGSLGLQERITAAATRLANNHRDNKTLRNDAMRAIGGNLSDLRKAMSLQRTFDMTTVKRVADLARVLMNNGYLNGLTQQEVKRLLAAVKNSVGHNDIEGDVQKVMDIMVDNQLKHAEDTLHELEAIRGSKVDARGVEVQGQLDPAGAHTMKVFKKTRGWEKTDIEEAISEAQQRMGSSDVAVADEAALEYTGLQLALEYAENIKDSKVEERKLREEIKQAHDDASERDRATDSYRQYIASLQEAIRQNKIERAQSYFDLVGRLSDSLRESIANAKDFKEAEKQRIREIQHNANSDMEGRPSDEHYKPTFADKFVNNSFVSFLFAPLATFDQMLRMFGGKSANGEGYLYNRFMRGWIDARQKEINGVRDKYAILDAKAAELFGGKVKTWGDLIRRVGKLPKGTVSFWNGGEMQERELTQGNLMYIYMVNKMLDGRMKLRKMGITEENVADIEEVLDPRLIELADWLQDEFLVQTRNEYNETHKRMFGASMAAIEHYFPLKILANARADKPEDLDNPDKSDGINTATGSIIKRRRNALALDITGADALSVILDHVAQMEHWNAFAEFNRDINTLRTYKRFRNQVQNMTTIYGSGKELWKKFNDVCQMAAGTYRPPRTKLDEAAVNFAKGVTAAKVSFRMFTALKQFLSMPAYIPEARTDYLLRNIANPVGAWKWSMEHLPIFSERWRSRMSGDPRLLKSDMDWKMWRTRIMQLASRAGMSPNAFVDALTVSIGAHSMYQTRLAQYLRDGYSEADAEKKAVQDAEVLYNQTQQSSEGAFTSTMQVDRSWLSVLFTVFRNASMSYQRQLHDALRNFKHNLTPGGRARSIEFMTKQLLRDKGIEPQTDGNWSDADWQREEQVAKRKFRRQLLKDTLRVATFGYIMQLAWNLGAYLPYLLFGDDEDEKQKMWDDVWAHTAFGSVEGLTGGDLMSQAGQMMLTGEGNPAYLSKDMPLTSDIMAAFQKLGNGQHTEALNDMINLIVQAGLGVNPQSITDVALSIMDACGDDPALAHEATICISRILQVPQSQIDKMYFDEVGLSGDEVSKYTPAQLAERYAQFKVKRGRFFSPWSWGDEERIKKFTDKANKTIKERTEQMGDDKVNEAYLQYEEVYKGVDAKVKEAKKTAKTDYVEAAQLMAEAQSDPNAFATYQMFKQMDGNFNKIVKFYLGAKTPDEAALCRQAVLDYKSAMVKVLEAPDAATRAEAMGNLGNVMQEFGDRYGRMQENNR